MKVTVEACPPSKRKSKLVTNVSLAIAGTLLFALVYPDKFQQGLTFVYGYVPEVVKTHVEVVVRAVAAAILPGKQEKSSPSLPMDEAMQMLLVDVPDWGRYEGVLQRYSRSSTSSPWVKEGESFRVSVGEKGLAWVDSEKFAQFKKQGDPVYRRRDVRSPAGVFRLGTAFGVYNPPSRLNRYDFKTITQDDLCVSTPNSDFFNRLVDRRRVSPAEAMSSITMSERDGRYRLGIIIDSPRDADNRESFSCLFLNASNGRGLPTVGSTELDVQDLEDIVYWLDQAKRPVLVQIISRDLNLIHNLATQDRPRQPDSLAER